MLGELIPVVAIIASAIVVINILKYRSGRMDGRRAAAPAGDGENIRLAHENADLRRTVGRLEERLAVLERIATDPAERTAREIENLRSR
jgi:hypothetical protein